MKIKKNLNKVVILFLLNIAVWNSLADKSYANINELTFNNMNIEQGISQSTTTVMLQESEGYFNDGLNRYNGYIGVGNIGIIDELQSNEFNGNATFKSNTGELFFGGINGLNDFYPADINKINTNTKVLFNTFYIDSKKYLDIDGMKFSKNTNNITIEFFSPVYSNNKNLIYEYKLIGSNGEISTTKNNYVTYNSLLPGKYTFKVRVIDGSGNKSEASYVNFIIKPPFWFSPLALLIYMSMTILLLLRSKYKFKQLDNLVNERTKDLEDEMRKNQVLNNENLKLERNKNSYLINLSHELRTPLNVISSTNQLIQSLTNKDAIISNEKLSYYTDISQRNCTRLLKLINNILDNSKLQNNKYEISLKETDIVYLVEETALTLIDYIKSKGIKLIVDPKIEEKQIKCDAYEIERCIINLVSNAVKFTPKGGSITVIIKDLDDKVEINVIDTGIGIDGKFHKSIFDRFNQVSCDGISKGGSGLGLTITREIINLHKGEIYVESKVGEGSKFVIILPENPDDENDK